MPLERPSKPVESGSRRAITTHRSRSTATEIDNHLGIDRESVVDATIASSNYTTLSTDMQFGRNDEHQTLAETFGALDDNLDKVLDIHTVQPLIAPLPEREQTI